MTKDPPENDHYHAMDFNDLKILRSEINKIEELMAMRMKKSIPSEELSRPNARRSIVTNRKLSKGHIIDEFDIVCKGQFSITANNWYEIIGSQVLNDLPEDYLVEWSDIKIVGNKVLIRILRINFILQSN